MIPRLSLLMLVTLATMFVTLGCSRAQISGSLYGVTLGGDAKRGADVEVLLVRRDEATGKKLRDLAAGRKAELAPVQAAFDQAQAAPATVTASYHDMSLAAASARASSARSQDAAFDAAKKIAELRKRYRDQAREILAGGKVATVRTDANGGFDFKDIKPGQYWIMAEWAVSRMEYSRALGNSYPVTDRIEWLVPIEVIAGANKVQLSSSNSGWPFALNQE
jgi:hypothetical protein